MYKNDFISDSPDFQCDCRKCRAAIKRNGFIFDLALRKFKDQRKLSDGSDLVGETIGSKLSECSSVENLKEHEYVEKTKVTMEGLEKPRQSSIELEKNFRCKDGSLRIASNHDFYSNSNRISNYGKRFKFPVIFVNKLTLEIEEKSDSKDSKISAHSEPTHGTKLSSNDHLNANHNEFNLLGVKSKRVNQFIDKKNFSIKIKTINENYIFNNEN